MILCLLKLLFHILWWEALFILTVFEEESRIDGNTENTEII